MRIPEAKFGWLEPTEFDRLRRLAGPALCYQTIVDEELRRESVSPWVRRVLLSEGDILTRDLASLIHEPDREQVLSVIHQTLRGEPGPRYFTFGINLGDQRTVAAAAETSQSQSAFRRCLVATVVVLDPERIATPENPLTGRQTEILSLVASGLSTSEIARQQFVSITTVRNHVADSCRRLGAHRRLEAVAIARQRGIIA